MILGTLGDVNPTVHDGGIVVDLGDGEEPRLFYWQTTGTGGHDDPAVRNFSWLPVLDDVLDYLDFVVDVAALADYIGGDPDEIRAQSVDPDPMVRAALIEEIARCHGWSNVAGDPVEQSPDAAAACLQSILARFGGDR